MKIVPSETGKLHVWEHVTENVTRLCVPGGWVYRFYEEEGPPAFVYVRSPRAPFQTNIPDLVSVDMVNHY